MRHAILVEASKLSNVVNANIELLDDYRFDFFIILDSKSNLQTSDFVKPKNSRVFFVPRIDIKWAHVSQVKAELSLLEFSLKTDDYDYFHIISDSDLTLMTADYFDNYFNEAEGKQFIHFEDFSSERRDRINFYYPELNTNLPRLIKRAIMLASTRIQRVIGVNRIDISRTVYSGSNWVSITGDFAAKILAKKDDYLEMFKLSRSADELIFQIGYMDVFCGDFSHVWDNNARLIDWERGHPFVFGPENIGELKNAVNTKFAFARKISPSNKFIKQLQERIEETN